MVPRMTRIGFVSLTLAFFGGFQAPAAFAQKKTSPAQDDPQMLSLEVVALQTLNRLDLSTPQLEALLRLAKGTAGTPRSTGAMKVTPAFLKTLKALRSALLDDDDDRIGDLKEKLGDLLDKDKIQLDDRVPISDAARRSAAQVIRLMQPGQVLAYLQVIDDEEVNLFEILDEAIEAGKGAEAGRWKALRDQAAGEAAWLIVGSDEAKSRVATKFLASLLDQHHNAKPGKNAFADLEKQVQQLTAHLDPFEILRHVMEREMAELLSNPRLPLAIQHTLDQRRKLAAK